MLMDFDPTICLMNLIRMLLSFLSHFRNLSETNAFVTVVNNTRVAFASLAADETCGNQTRLIYYMDPGEVLSRPFTARDTHSLKGELLVKHTDAKLAGGEFGRRSMGTNVVLGFHGRSFTYDNELILPAEINVQLREILRVAMGKSGFYKEDDDSGTNLFTGFLDSLSSNHSENASIFIPEVYFV